jgi:2-C-methyl-D-erythritol 4-phosphate cytidylyltransferase
MKNNKELFVSVVIPAAGKGSRMNANKDKQFIKIKGKPVLALTIEAFQNCSLVDEIVLVTSKDQILKFKQDIVDKYRLTKVSSIQDGGNERQQSVMKGLEAVDGKCDIVLIHDGVRPFISERTITATIDAAREFGAACACVQQKDSIKVGDENDFIQKSLDRSKIWIAQTPQAFKYKLVMDAHLSAEKDGFFGNDDSVLVERFCKIKELETKVKIVTGQYDNIKITTDEDIIIADAIAESRGN